MYDQIRGPAVEYSHIRSVDTEIVTQTKEGYRTILECANTKRADDVVALLLSVPALLDDYDRLKERLEAAIADASGFCESCAFRSDCAKHDPDGISEPRWFFGDCEDWQWRGQKEGQ